jgi:hypothetical protein
MDNGLHNASTAIVAIRTQLTNAHRLDPRTQKLRPDYGIPCTFTVLRATARHRTVTKTVRVSCPAYPSAFAYPYAPNDVHKKSVFSLRSVFMRYAVHPDS